MLVQFVVHLWLSLFGVLLIELNGKVLGKLLGFFIGKHKLHGLILSTAPEFIIQFTFDVFYR